MIKAFTNSLPISTIEINNKMLAPSCNPFPSSTKAFTSSTVYFSIIALTYAAKEPINVKNKVPNTNHL